MSTSRKRWSGFTQRSNIAKAFGFKNFEALQSAVLIKLGDPDYGQPSPELRFRRLIAELGLRRTRKVLRSMRRKP